FTYIKKGVPEDFLLISGDDSLILPHLALGANGAISVTANAIPSHYSKLIQLAQSNNFKDALTLHLKLIEFTDSLFDEGSPSGVKAALKELGIMGNDVRLPLVPVTQKQEEKIKKLLAELPKI
ncbi:MAG: dihydrodipicolinate synthase family protein, partial [Bacteroidota bacterium]